MISSALVQAQRKAICRACKWRKPTTDSCGTLLLGGKVYEDGPKENKVKHYKRPIKLCGCKIAWKVKLKAQKCPADKWAMDGLSDEDIEQIRKWVDAIPTKGSWNIEDLRPFYAIASKIKGANIKPSTCSSCLRTLVDEMRTLVNNIEPQ